MWRGEELTSGLVNKIWYYENVCITYGAEGRGTVRFRNQHAIPIRWGVLSRSTGVPEVTTTGHWLLYHQGIGDPQIEQLTFHPETETVGEAWPFRIGTCPF
jgi:hypothetical protein